ncbi:unnamed protein product [Euphydryas editha]|uniref:Uncharacterized protein n=1 Tax=Euphydryas editha TaxID=104508 RepID=A0AAU9TXS9_EUPED|nr:unnamed protein product [Euphydryas editha]
MLPRIFSGTKENGLSQMQVSCFLSPSKIEHFSCSWDWTGSMTACQSTAVMYNGLLNPARSLGLAVIMNIWFYHWLYSSKPILA